MSVVNHIPAALSSCSPYLDAFLGSREVTTGVTRRESPVKLSAAEGRRTISPYGEFRRTMSSTAMEELLGGVYTDRLSTVLPSSNNSTNFVERQVPPTLLQDDCTEENPYSPPSKYIPYYSKGRSTTRLVLIFEIHGNGPLASFCDTVTIPYV